MIKDKIGAGIVAENIQVFLSAPSLERMCLTSSMNPISNISSASSKTANLALSRIKTPRSIKSNTRPGVPTTICGRSRRRPLIWPSREIPP